MRGRWSFALILAVGLACGSDDGGTGASGPGTADAGSGDGDGGSADGGSGSADDDGGSGDDGSDTGATTPCSSNGDCAGTEYCNFADESCGTSGASGSCVARSTCDSSNRPVCGCDDTVYDSICDAAAAGQDIAFRGQCTPPNGAYSCGFSYCIAGTEYCAEQGGAMPSHECVELPPVCQPPDCGCLVGNCCGCENASCCLRFCIHNGDELTVTCPGE